ncbi:MAG: hypothetical protein KF768_02080 [Phycisphaeraceae bacterium]|nr:hypothetical protein [Phycisphaeraceae bacterium]
MNILPSKSPRVSGWTYSFGVSRIARAAGLHCTARVAANATANDTTAPIGHHTAAHRKNRRVRERLTMLSFRGLMNIDARDSARPQLTRTRPAST